MLFLMVMMLHNVTFLFHHSESQHKMCAVTGVRLDRRRRIIEVTPQSVQWLSKYHGVDLHVGDLISEVAYSKAYKSEVVSRDSLGGNGWKRVICESVVYSLCCCDIVAFAAGCCWVHLLMYFILRVSSIVMWKWKMWRVMDHQKGSPLLHCL